MSVLTGSRGLDSAHVSHGRAEHWLAEHTHRWYWYDNQCAGVAQYNHQTNTKSILTVPRFSNETVFFVVDVHNPLPTKWSCSEQRNYVAIAMLSYVFSLPPPCPLPLLLSLSEWCCGCNVRFLRQYHSTVHRETTAVQKYTGLPRTAHLAQMGHWQGPGTSLSLGWFGFRFLKTHFGAEQS